MLSANVIKPPQADAVLVGGALNGVPKSVQVGIKPWAKPARLPQPFRVNRCLFINLPGCEGGAIHTALFGGWDPGHVPLSWYERRFPREYAASFTFTFVRDPVERVYVAWARWMEARLFVTAESGEDFDPGEGFEGFVSRWLREEHIHRHVDFAPQADFLTDARGALKLDFIGRYESLERDFGSLRDFLCIRATLPWSAPAYERAPGARYAVSSWARKRIRQVYAQDYALLGFE
jgi:hypothetical protein